MLTSSSSYKHVTLAMLLSRHFFSAVSGGIIFFEFLAAALVESALLDLNLGISCLGGLSVLSFWSLDVVGIAVFNASLMI